MGGVAAVTKPPVVNLPSLGLLSITTGRLMGDMQQIYSCAEFLVGRAVYTHELSHYRRRMAEVLCARYPALDLTAGAEDWKAVRDGFVDRHGLLFAVAASLRESCRDGRTAAETLRLLKPDADVIIIEVPDDHQS